MDAGELVGNFPHLLFHGDPLQPDEASAKTPPHPSMQKLP